MSWMAFPDDELEDYLRKLLAIADANGDGCLQPDEFTKLLSLSGLQFDPQMASEVRAAGCCGRCSEVVRAIGVCTS